MCGLKVCPRRRRGSALKAQGFSGRPALADLVGSTEARVRDDRRALGVRPVFKRIDTCAGEFRAETPYMYSTYETGALGQGSR